MLVAMAGLPGTGKSTLARALAEALRDQGAKVLILDKDHVRASLFQPEDIAYSHEQDDLCIDMMLHVAEYLLRHEPERIIILDGRTFSRCDQVQTVVRAAADIGVTLVFIECHCSEATAIERLAQDQARQTHPAGNRGPELYQRILARGDRITIDHLTVNTEEPLAGNVQTGLTYLAGAVSWSVHLVH